MTYYVVARHLRGLRVRVMAVLTQEEKQRILEAIERDREFRYALMGLLGYREVLERIARLEERTLRIEERQQRLEEEVKRVWEEIARMREECKRLWEAVKNMLERMERLENRVDEFDRLVKVIGHRFGVITEEKLRHVLKFVVEDVLKMAKVSKMSLRDEEGIVYGHPAVVDIDVAVTDKEHIIIEFKSRASRGDVAELYCVGRLYEKLMGVRPRLLLVAGYVDPDAWESAARLGVEVRPAIRGDTPRLP